MAAKTLSQSEQESGARGAACREAHCEPHNERRGSDGYRSAEPQSVGCLYHLDRTQVYDRYAGCIHACAATQPVPLWTAGRFPIGS